MSGLQKDTLADDTPITVVLRESQRVELRGLLERAMKEAMLAHDFGLECRMRQIRDVLERA